MNYLEHHLAHHAPRGFGDAPATCPVCPHDHPELAKRLDAIEGKAARTDSMLVRIGIAAGASIVAAYVVEKFIRRG